jgi:hypothetical protein
MVEDISWEESFVNSTNHECSTNYDDTSSALVVRGIIKRKYIRAAESQNRDFYYMDTGYFGNFFSPGNPSGKKIWHRVVKNELQKSVIEDFPSDRWDSLVKSDPRLAWKGWKKPGDKILVVIPNPKSCDFFGIDYEEWKNSTIQTVKKLTDKKVVIREKGSRSQRQHYSIYDALDDGVFATVTFNSIAAMESIAYGVPAFVSVSCAASPLAETDLTKINSPYYPKEKLIQKHCQSLAYGQFTAEEISNGTAWKILKKD